MSQEHKQEMNIELGEDVAQGEYSNLVVISHSTSEFVLDFAALMPGVPKAKVKSRIILTPEHAKRLLMTLQDNITRYESNVARIDIPHPRLEEDSDKVTMSFNVGEA
ncbi:MAG: DUF3467 domain-containing protein [Rikenellaceae bacterium]|jgi:hypothetical protein|nr:DUF3467 domain-containing protein [Rikenellaceae bacterium]